jgi:hypothetical protein
MRTQTESAATARRGVKALACTLPVVIAILLACGCVEVKDTLTIKADGSGTVRIETVVHQSALLSQMGYRGMMMGDVGALMYPPSDVQTARTFFPGDGFEVKVKRNRQSPGTTGVIVEVEFKDVNALIGSPYGQAHSLRLERDGDELVLTVRSGMEHLAHGEQFLKADHEDGMGEMLKDAGKEYDKLAFEFTIELPGEAAVEGDVVTAAGNTVTWAVDLSEAEDRAKAVERLDAVVTARCRAKELAFTPQPVTRLDLCAFDKLADGKLADAPAVDTEKIKAQARFVPVALRVEPLAQS